MGRKPVTCVLGELQVRDHEEKKIEVKDRRRGTTEDVMTIRQFIWTEREPSTVCLEACNTIAEGIEGIKAVIRNIDPFNNCSLVLSLREDVDPTSTGKHFIVALAAALNGMSVEKQAAMLNDSDLIAAAVAVHSKTRNTDD